MRVINENPIRTITRTIMMLRTFLNLFDNFEKPIFFQRTNSGSTGVDPLIVSLEFLFNIDD